VLGLVALLLLGALGAAVALGIGGPPGDDETLLRVRGGVTETGVVETITVAGAEQKVVRWRTRGGVVTDSLPDSGLTVIDGQTLFVAGPTATVTRTVAGAGWTTTVVGPGQTVTLPAETVVQTVTETLPGETVTVVQTVTETVPALP
jgi:hypothetical protein